MTIFPDNICLWTAARFNKTLAVRMQTTLDNTNSYLTFLGLSLYPEKSTDMVFSDIGRRASKVPLALGLVPIWRVLSQRFLGLHLDTRTRRRCYTKAVAASCIAPLNCQKKSSRNTCTAAKIATFFLFA